MTILDLLKKAGLSGDALLTFLNTASQRFPDLATEAQRLAVMLSSSISEASLIAVASALPAEIAAIAKGQLDPADHPSDAI